MIVNLCVDGCIDDGIVVLDVVYLFRCVIGCDWCIVMCVVICVL